MIIRYLDPWGEGKMASWKYILTLRRIRGSGLMANGKMKDTHNVGTCLRNLGPLLGFLI